MRKELFFFWLFVALQATDAATTALGLHLGAVEGNGLVGCWLSLAGPWAGLLVVKALGLLLAALVYLRGHHRVYRDASVLFSAVVAWNCTILARMLL